MRLSDNHGVAILLGEDVTKEWTTPCKYRQKPVAAIFALRYSRNGPQLSEEWLRAARSAWM